MGIGNELERLLACDPAIRVTESPQLTDEPKIGVFSARRGHDTVTAGHGIDTGSDRARLKAVAEALERVCLYLPDEAKIAPLRFGAVESQLDPSEFWSGAAGESGPTERDLRRLREAPRLWTRGARIRDRSEILIPAEMAYLDAARHTAAPIRPESISTGAALGAAGSGEAFTRGLFEVIERDAFMGVWSGERTPHRISGATLADDPLYRQIERYRLEPRVFDLGCELGPAAVVCITIDRSGIGPAVTAGLAARGAYRQAVRSALLESVGCRRGIRVRMARGKWAPPGPAEQISSAEARAAFWTPVDSIDLLPRWVFDAPKRSLDSLEPFHCDTEKALRELTQREMEIYECDLTTAPLAARGFEVVRVIVPGLTPLHMVERARARRSWRGALTPSAEGPPHPFL